MKILLFVLFLGVIQINFSQTMIQIPLVNDASHPSFLIENLQTKSSDKLSEIIEGPISINADKTGAFYILDQIGNKILPYHENGIPRKPIQLDDFENTAEYSDLAILNSEELIVYNQHSRRFSLVSQDNTKETSLSPRLPKEISKGPFIVNHFTITPDKRTLVLQNDFDGFLYTTSLANLFTQQHIKLQKIKNSNTPGMTDSFHKKHGFLSWTVSDPAKQEIQFSHLNSKRKLKNWFTTTTFEHFAGLKPLSFQNNSFVFALFKGAESSFSLNQIRIANVSNDQIEETTIPLKGNQLPWYTSKRACSNGNKVYIMSYHKKLRSLNIDIISISQNNK